MSLGPFPASSVLRSSSTHCVCPRHLLYQVRRRSNVEIAPSLTIGSTQHILALVTYLDLRKLLLHREDEMRG